MVFWFGQEIFYIINVTLHNSGQVITFHSFGEVHSIRIRLQITLTVEYSSALLNVTGWFKDKGLKLNREKKPNTLN